MKFKEFEAWCNERACDGCWGMITAMACIYLVGKMRKIPFWKREKEWRNHYEQQVLDEIVNPIEEKMKELGVSK